MVYELVGYNMNQRYQNNIRYRAYTQSERKATLFERIPKIQFTDSGHGIVFNARIHKGARKNLIKTLASYVNVHLRHLLRIEKLEKERLVYDRLRIAATLAIETINKHIAEAEKAKEETQLQTF